MLASVTITDLTKAVKLSYNPHPQQTLWVGMCDPETRGKLEGAGRRFRSNGVYFDSKNFHDWSDEDGSAWVQEQMHIHGPQFKHVLGIKAFLQPHIYGYKEHHLGVNCYAGIARSTAIGVMAWAMAGCSAEDAFQRILEVRPQAQPNLRMLGFASQILHMDLVTPAKNHRITALRECNTPNAEAQIHRILGSTFGKEPV